MPLAMCKGFQGPFMAKGRSASLDYGRRRWVLIRKKPKKGLEPLSIQIKGAPLPGPKTCYLSRRNLPMRCRALPPELLEGEVVTTT